MLHILLKKKNRLMPSIRICDGLVPVHVFLVLDYAYPGQLLCGRETIKSYINIHAGVVIVSWLGIECICYHINDAHVE